MANAVVAVFDEYNEAQSAVNELIVAGFEKDEVRLTGDGDGHGQPMTREEKPRERGFKGFFKSLFKEDQEDQDIRLYDEAIRHGNFVVTAIAKDEAKSDIASEVMRHHHPVDLEEKSTEWLSPDNTRSPTTTESRAVPVIEEEVKIGKREVQRGAVRIFQRVSEVPISEDVTLKEVHVVVERVPVDRPATEADLSQVEEGATELRETAEEPVVSKVARVVEEVHVGKEVTERTQKVKDTALRTDVEIHREGDEDYKAHFEQSSSSEGGRYEEYLPAYEYGSTAAGSKQFAGRTWTDIEPDLQRDWEARNPGSKWERFKDSIRHAFERLRK